MAFSLGHRRFRSAALAFELPGGEAPHVQSGVAGTQIVAAELKLELSLCRFNGTFAQSAADALSRSSPYAQWTVVQQFSFLQRRARKRPEGHLVVIH